MSPFSLQPLVSVSRGYVTHSKDFNRKPVDIFLLGVGNENARTKHNICSKLIKKTPEWYQWRRSGVYIVNFKKISHIAIMFPLLTFNLK